MCSSPPRYLRDSVTVFSSEHPVTFNILSNNSFVDYRRRAGSQS